MKKQKILNTKLYDMFSTMFGDAYKVQLEAKQAEERLKKGNPAFNCKKCSSLFTPEPHQWIFYQLCDSCFAKFDLQKMMGRIAAINNEKNVKYFEDSDEWIKENIY